jgi:hypothetical protein
MKVFTHYKTIEENNEGYRWRTLLQFGTSWDIIGSAVMMNPGSANYKYSDKRWIDDTTTLNYLAQFDYPCDCGEKWYEFKDDPTLRFVADLFAAYMKVPSKNELQGVIQIFNLFYLREPKLGDALYKNKSLSILKQINDSIFEYDIKALKQPVYLGFGTLSHSSDFREKAYRYFKEVKEKHNAKYLSDIFEENPFYHPRALMLFMKNNPKGIVTRLQFCGNCLTSDLIEKTLSSATYQHSRKQTFDMDTIVDNVGKAMINMGLSQMNDSREKFRLTPVLQLTVTKKSGGYVAIRHFDFDPKRKYGDFEYSDFQKYRTILDSFSFKSDSNWIGIKQLKKYGKTEQEITENIIRELSKIKELV